MKILTSPAKSQDFELPWQLAIKPTEPAFLQEATKFVKLLAQMNKSKLEKTLSISSTLAERNVQAYKDWTPTHTARTAKPALLAYTGDVYQQLSAHLYTKHQQTYAQESVRILTGLYGYLRAYDLIRPYRLEMKTKLPIESDKKPTLLSAFWQEKVTKQLGKELAIDQSPVVINLASQEYSAAIDWQQLKHPFYHITFQQIKGKEQPKVIGILAKRARGRMLDNLIRNQVTTLEGVKQFAIDGYELTAERENELVFTAKVS